MSFYIQSKNISLYVQSKNISFHEKQAFAKSHPFPTLLFLKHQF